MSRDELRKACLDRLEQRATEHPSGHQGKLAARYIVHREDGERIGLMFEKGEKTQPNLWVEHLFARELMEEDIEFRIHLASSLYQPAADGGKPAYGRHAGLKAMRDLANADLVRFTIRQIPQLDLILDRLVCFSRSDVWVTPPRAPTLPLASERVELLRLPGPVDSRGGSGSF